jgi:hypothetical protein
MFPHPPYSPDLAARDFWVFPEIKLTMKGNHFDVIPEIEVATKECIRALVKDDFQNYFRSWQDCWRKCIDSRGDYFEGANCTLKLIYSCVFR